MNLYTIWQFLLLSVSLTGAWWILSTVVPNNDIPVQRLNINDFNETQKISDDTWNNLPASEVRLTYFTKDTNQEIGYIDYRRASGQVGLFRLDEQYRNKGLGKQILQRVIDDLKQHGIKSVWAVTTKDHEFWSNVFNKSFQYREPIQLPCTGHGYALDISDKAEPDKDIDVDTDGNTSDTV